MKCFNSQLNSIGGEEAEENEFPWAALLVLRSSETNRTNRCGGTLISSQHVLTAAHCLKEFSNKGEVNVVWDDITVVLGEIEILVALKMEIISEYFSGEHDVEDDSETVTFKSKAEGISHPRFYYRLSLGEIDYDVGLLTLETPIDFTNETFSHIR